VGSVGVSKEEKQDFCRGHSKRHNGGRGVAKIFGRGRHTPGVQVSIKKSKRKKTLNKSTQEEAGKMGRQTNLPHENKKVKFTKEKKRTGIINRRGVK